MLMLGNASKWLLAAWTLEYDKALEICPLVSNLSFVAHTRERIFQEADPFLNSRVYDVTTGQHTEHGALAGYAVPHISLEKGTL
jgi:hypothetical protein